MRLWQGILVSVLFHAALFCVSVDVSKTWESPTCEEMRFVIEEGGREGSASEEREGSMPAGGEPPGSVAESVPEPAAPPEEQPDLAELDDGPPAPEEAPATAMLAKEAPKPPRPAPKPPRPAPKPLRSAPKPPERARKAPPPEKPAKAQPRAGPVEESAAPAAEPIARQAGSELGSGHGEDPSQGAAGHSATPGEGGPAGRGPVESSFGSGDGPRFLDKAIPKYPRLARELGREGTVLLRLTIDERGRLLGVDVVKRAGSGFDEEAVRAVRSSTFSPAKKGGKPVMCRAQLPIRFVLRSSGND